MYLIPTTNQSPVGYCLSPSYWNENKLYIEIALTIT